ncbi:T9SS type A sorting domain-containing protein [Lewinella lacunae]|uniref:T9SS type A sorting domain-containing protein n=1 Tax=Neolewinella lacunae TaxID=1517758 RepID=A0A923PHQ0_9BACT|nr:T9SS type A sorting domain-containing protein [Neolewinella lacunae]MBC6994277.1 T9SS type A sorting domain-containing protein [Neolewinella lacunae]
MASFRPTRTDGTGLADGDLFGYAGNLTVADELGMPPTEGNQAYIMEDTDGEVTLRFAPIRLNPAAGANFSMDYILDGNFASDAGGNDRLQITLEITGCAGATTLVLLNADGDGGAETDLDDILDQRWNTINQNLNAYLQCDVTLVIVVDFNNATEEVAFDNINFSSGTVLPVEFTTFSARQDKNDVRLHWETAEETDNRGFGVERSEDGRQFREIGWVSGAGEAARTTEYTYTDTEVVAGQDYYYRLRQEDFDGSFTYSDLVFVKMQEGGLPAREARFYPNPTVTGQSWIDLSADQDGEWELTVFDAAGRRVLENRFALAAGLHTVSIDLAQQKKGAYLVRIVGPEGTLVRRLLR